MKLFKSKKTIVCGLIVVGSLWLMFKKDDGIDTQSVRTVTQVEPKVEPESDEVEQVELPLCSSLTQYSEAAFKVIVESKNCEVF